MLFIEIIIKLIIYQFVHFLQQYLEIPRKNRTLMLLKLAKLFIRRKFKSLSFAFTNFKFETVLIQEFNKDSLEPF